MKLKYMITVAKCSSNYAWAVVYSFQIKLSKNTKCSKKAKRLTCMYRTTEKNLILQPVRKNDNKTQQKCAASPGIPGLTRLIRRSLPKYPRTLG